MLAIQNENMPSNENQDIQPKTCEYKVPPFATSYVKFKSYKLLIIFIILSCVNLLLLEKLNLQLL